MSSNYPAGFSGGLTVRGVPVDIPHPGQVFWVNNSTTASHLAPKGVGGSNNNPGTYQKPFQTIEYAIGKCSAGRGDVIYVMPNHSEAVSAANGIDFDVAGITVIGLGEGSTQAQVRFTAAAASITIDAADITWVNMRFTAAFADVAQAIDLNAGGDGFRSINCLYDEEEANENYVIVFGVADGANDLRFHDNRYFGDDASNDSFFVGAGTCDKTEFIGNHFEHDTAQTSVIAILRSATAMTNCRLLNNTFVTAETVLAASCVVFTGTANTGFAGGNTVCALDSDATAANATSALDVTGMFGGQNYVADAVDKQSILFAQGDLT